MNKNLFIKDMIEYLLENDYNLVDSDHITATIDHYGLDSFGDLVKKYELQGVVGDRDVDFYLNLIGTSYYGVEIELDFENFVRYVLKDEYAMFLTMFEEKENE